jgi:O-antigen ligase
LTSPFYGVYGSTNYVWFSTSFLVLETGLVGFVLYCMFFVTVLIEAHKKQKNGEADAALCQMSMVMAIMSLFFVVYNVSMRTESAYLVYFILALPFIKGRIPARHDTVQYGEPYNAE